VAKPKLKEMVIRVAWPNIEGLKLLEVIAIDLAGTAHKLRVIGALEKIRDERK
jgi:hypothetical protein